jgi:ketosteroid isomerase-like protein
MSAENVDIVRSAYQALAMRQLQKILQLAAPDLQVEQSPDLPWGGHYRGIAGLQQFMVRLTQHVDSVMTPELFVDAGDQVVAVGRTRGTARRSGLTFDASAVHVWTLREGKLAHFQGFVDHAPILSALGAVVSESAILSRTSAD